MRREIDGDFPYKISRALSVRRLYAFLLEVCYEGTRELRNSTSRLEVVLGR